MEEFCNLLESISIRLKLIGFFVNIRINKQSKNNKKKGAKCLFQFILFLLLIEAKKSNKSFNFGARLSLKVSVFKICTCLLWMTQTSHFVLNCSIILSENALKTLKK